MFEVAPDLVALRVAMLVFDQEVRPAPNGQNGHHDAALSSRDTHDRNRRPRANVGQWPLLCMKAGQDRSP